METTYDKDHPTQPWMKKIAEENDYLNERFDDEEIELPEERLEHVTGFNIPEAGYYE